jgi:hypothetical protein
MIEFVAAVIADFFTKKTGAYAQFNLLFHCPLAQEPGVPYQTLINLYLRACAASHKKLALHWKTA